MAKWKRSLTLISMGVVIIIGFSACGEDDPASSETVTLTIINGLVNYTIYDVYVSPSTLESWGIDRLGEDRRLSPGKSVTLELEKGTYDIRIVDEDGDEYVKSNLQLTAHYTWRITLADLS